MNKSIFTFFAFLIFISFGCSSQSGTTNTTATTNSAANTTAANTVAQTEPEIDITKPFEPSANPKDDLISSTKRLQVHNSWSATLVSNLYPEMKTEMQYVAPDRFHFINPVNEMVIIGNDGYQKQGKTWAKLTGDFNRVIDQMKQSFNAETIKAISEVKKTGVEKIDGKDATVYEYSNPDQNLPQNVTRLWISNDGLPLKRMLETQNASETQRISITYDYDKPVKIEAPKIQ